MNRFTIATLASFAGTATATAGALDRSGQDIDIIFEEGTRAELSFGYVAPDIAGTDNSVVVPSTGASIANGTQSGDVADNYFQGSVAYKQQINDAFSVAIIIDQPYGADIDYSSDSIALGGTSAKIDSIAYTAMLRYKFNENFSVHGGIRGQQVNAAVTLGGLGYGPLNGYEGIFDGDTIDAGWQAGFAYEIPDIALRFAVTYFSEIEHKFDAIETLPVLGVDSVESGSFDTLTPEAVNVSFQTGIAEGTLVFASFRYAGYQDTLVIPPTFASITGGASLVSIDPVRDFAIGIGRQFTDKFAASFAVNYSDTGPDNNVSPLAPIDGRYGFTLGGSYQVTEALEISGGVNYTRFINADPTVGGVQLANFDDNDAYALGLQIGYNF